MENFILVNKSANILHIKLNRPEKLNAINLKMYTALNDALDLAINDNDIRAVLISSTSENFTSGNDLEDFLLAADDIKNSNVVKFIYKIAKFNKPVIAAVTGNAVGIGTTLLLHCDLIYAQPSATFTTPFTQLGLVPEAGSTHLLPKLIGQAKAAKMLMLGEALTAQQAEQAGLVTEVYDGTDFIDYVMSKAIKLTKLPQQAVLETRSLLKDADDNLTTKMQKEVAIFSKLLKSSEFLDIVKAFLHKS